MVAAFLVLFCELKTLARRKAYSVFRECDVIDLLTGQMCGRMAIHDVTRHSATFCDALNSELSLAAAWLLWKLRVAREHRSAATQHQTGLWWHFPSKVCRYCNQFLNIQRLSASMTVIAVTVAALRLHHACKPALCIMQGKYQVTCRFCLPDRLNLRSERLTRQQVQKRVSNQARTWE